MSTIPLIIAVAILLISVLMQARRVPSQQQTSDVLSSPTTTPTHTPTDTPIPTHPTATHKPTFTPSPTIAPGTSGEISSLIYPGSIITSHTGAAFELESTDNAAAITDWYKARIKDRGMNTTSFVQTKTNGNVLNALVATGNRQKISITIKSNELSSTVSIDVSLQTY